MMSSADDWVRRRRRGDVDGPPAEPEEPQSRPPLVTQGGRSEQPGPKIETADQWMRRFARGAPVEAYTRPLD
jgi:hypothetical protein